LYITLFLLPLLIIPQYRIVFIFAIVTLLLSIYTYARWGTWGTMWCWIANVFSLFIIAKIVLWDHFTQWCSK
jgi:hypothetical protein